MRFTPLLFLIFTFLILIPLASAESFSDNFNTGGFASGWSSDGHVYFYTATPVDGTYYAQMAVPYDIYEFYRTFDGISMFELDFKYTDDSTGSLGEGYINFTFDYNGTVGNYLQAKDTGTDTYDMRFRTNVEDTDYSSVTLNDGLWYHLKVEKSLSLNTYKIWITLASDDSLISYQDINIDRIIDNPDKFEIFVGGRPAGYVVTQFDNVYIETAPELDSVYWSQSEYIYGSSPKIVWSINTSTWDATTCGILGIPSLCKYYIEVKLNGEPYVISKIGDPFFFNAKVHDITGFSYIVLGSGMQSGSYIFTPIAIALDIGEYTITTYSTSISDPLEFGSPFKQIVSKYPIQTAVIRAKGTPYISVLPYVLVDYPFDITYNFAEVLDGISYAYIDVKRTDSSGNEQYIQAIGDGKEHTITNASVHSSGEYSICLGDTGMNTGVCKVLTANIGMTPPQTNIYIPYLNLTKTSYFWSETLSGMYGIDNVNWTKLNMTKYFRIYNTDRNVQTMFGHISQQQQSFGLEIKEDIYYFWEGAAQYLPSHFEPGNNRFDILLKNSTTEQIISSASFTLGNVDENGYGIRLSKSIVDKNEKFTVFVYCPTNCSYQRINLESGSQIEKNFAGNKIFTDSIAKSGNYSYNLFDTSGYARGSAYIQVKESVSPPTTPTTPADITTDILADGTYIAIMILLMFGLGGAFLTKSAIGAVVGFSGAFIILAVYEMIPVWALFLFAIVAIIALAALMGKGISSGGGN